MTLATSLQSDFNDFVSKYGGSIYHFPVTSGVTNEWGDVSDGAKHPTSGIITGFVQSYGDEVSKGAQGPNANNTGICFTGSVNRNFRIGDKIEYQGINYEVTRVDPKSVSDVVAYFQLILNTLQEI